MLPSMAKDKDRIRVTIDIDHRRRRAFALFAAANDMSIPEAFSAMIDAQLGEFLALADKFIAAEAAPAKPSAKKPKPT